VGALSVGAPILGPPVPVGHASAGGSWPADVTPQQVAVDRGHHHAVGAGAPGITDTLNRLPASQRHKRHDRRWQRYEKPVSSASAASRATTAGSARASKIGRYSADRRPERWLWSRTGGILADAVQPFRH